MKSKDMKPAKNTGESYKYDRLNKSDRIETDDYITLLKKGILLDLKFDNIEVSNGKEKKLLSSKYVHALLVKRLGLGIMKFKNLDDAQEFLLNRIYSILREIMNHGLYPSHDKKQVIKESLKKYFKENGINETIDDLLINIFDEFNNKTKILTRLDLMSVRGLSRHKLKNLLFNEAGIEQDPKNTAESEEKLMKTINSVYKKTLYRMRNNFGIKIPSSYNRIWGPHDLEAFIDFILSAGPSEKKGYSKLVNCAILKTMTAYNEIFKDKTLIENLTHLLYQIIDNIKSDDKLGFDIESEKEGELVFSHLFEDGGETHYFQGKITYRTKDGGKILQKLIYNRKYSNIDFMTDLIGFRLEVENEEYAVNAIKFFSKIFFEGTVTFDDKGFFSEKTTQKLKQECGIRPRNKGRKNTSSLDFINFSMYGKVKGIELPEGTVKNPSVEIQIVYTGNGNETLWYNKHEIYDSKKMISVISRLFGYITLEHIKLIIKDIGVRSGKHERDILKLFCLGKEPNIKPYLMKIDVDNPHEHLFTSTDVFNEQLNNLHGGEIKTRFITEPEFNNLWLKYSKI